MVLLRDISADRLKERFPRYLSNTMGWFSLHDDGIDNAPIYIELKGKERTQQPNG